MSDQDTSITDNLKKFYNKHKKVINIGLIVFAVLILVVVIGIIIYKVVNKDKIKDKNNTEEFTYTSSEDDDRYDFASSWINSIVGNLQA